MLRPDYITISPPKSNLEKSFLRRFDCFIVYFIGKHKTRARNSKIESHRRSKTEQTTTSRDEKPPKKATQRKTAGIFYHFENRTRPEQIVKSGKNLHRIFGNFKMEILDILEYAPGGSKKLALNFREKIFEISKIILLP